MPNTKNNEIINYIEALHFDRKQAINKLRNVINNNLSEGLEEGFFYNMITYYIPHSKYPAGYHCNPKLPLPFISIASQKNFISLYHMGMYADTKLLNWFQKEFEKKAKGKLDMGKSCIRFKNIDEIPFELLGELTAKMNADEWIKCYEKAFVKKKK
jgi:hypothetical protein